MLPNFLRPLITGTLILASSGASLFAQTTAFNYQGVLNFQGKPTTGSYDFIFNLYDAESGGTHAGVMVSLTAVTVTEGRFSLVLDFGPNSFDGTPRWVEVAVRATGNGSYSYLSPRQPVLAVPYAVQAKSAQSAVTAQTAQVATGVAPNSVATAGIQAGAVTAAKIAQGQVVKSINGLSDTVTIEQGPGVAVSASGNKVTISATGGGGGTAGWGLTGNTGTTPGPNFLGTTDDKPLLIKANNVGIGTATPQTALDVAGMVTADAFAGNGSALTGVAAQLPTPFHFDLLSVTSTDYNRAVAVLGDYAYVANWSQGLAIYDIGDPFRPRLMSKLNLNSGDAQDVRVMGHYAFVATSKGLSIVDVTEPGQPSLVWSDQSSEFYSMEVQGLYAYGGAADGRLRIYMVSNPSTPVAVTPQLVGGQGLGIAASGNYIYLANGSDGFRILRFDPPGTVTAVGHVPQDPSVQGTDSSVVLSGSYAIVGSENINEYALQIFDVSDPSRPELVNTQVLGGLGQRLAVSGKRLFVPCSSVGTVVYDISDIRNLKELGHAECDASEDPLLCFANGVAVQGLFAYVTRYQDLAVYFASHLATIPGAVNATGFVGDGTTLTNLNAGQLVKGDVPLAALDNAWKIGGNSKLNAGGFMGMLDKQPLNLGVDGRTALRMDPAGIPASGWDGQTALLTLQGNLRLSGRDLWLRGLADTNHGLGWYGSARRFGGAAPDGPVLYGFGGGALGTTLGGARTALEWDAVGTVKVSELVTASMSPPGLGPGISALALDARGLADTAGWDAQAALLTVEGNLRLPDHDVWFRGSGDTNHGVGWYGSTRPFGEEYPDGPVLYGYGGGALATVADGPKTVFRWNRNGVTAENFKTVGTLEAGTVQANRVDAENLPAVGDLVYEREVRFADPGDHDILLYPVRAPADGFLFVIATAEVDLKGVSFDLKIWQGDFLKTTQSLLALDFGLLGPANNGVITVMCVDPVKAGEIKTYTLKGSVMLGAASVTDSHMHVMYFPGSL